MEERLSGKDDDRLTREALSLPDEARAELADRLLESLGAISGSGLTKEQEKELIRRIEAYERGETIPVPATDVFKRLRAQLGGVA